MPLLTIKKKKIHLSSRGKPNPLFTPSIITAVRTPNRVPRGGPSHVTLRFGICPLIIPTSYIDRHDAARAP